MHCLTLECPVPFRPYFLDERETFVVVDDEDYEWMLQWNWNIVLSQPRAFRPRKAYVRRGTRVNNAPISVYLHKAICLRAYGPPPSPLHVIGDHKDGQTLNCRRRNLRWATRRENNLNLFGDYARQQQLFNEETIDAALRSGSDEAADVQGDVGGTCPF